MSHARYFGASGMDRAIKCPGSVLLADSFPNRGSADASLGSCAHALGEFCFKEGIEASEMIGQALPDFPDIAIDADMAAAVQMYLDTLALTPADTHFIEQRVSYSAFVLRHAPAAAHVMGAEAEAFVRSDKFREIIEADCFGTGDYIGTNMDTDTLYGWDYKNGVNPVYADDNAQLRCYGLGALELYGWMADFKTVQSGIVQPNAGAKDPDHPLVVSETISVDALVTWGATVLVPAIIRSLMPDAPFTPGEKQCMWCRAKGACMARAQWVDDQAKALAVEAFADVNLADPADITLPLPSTMTHDQIGRVMELGRVMDKWLKDVHSHAERLAIEEGIIFHNHKVIQGTKLRTWIDEAKADKALANAGIAVDVRRKPWSLISPAQAEKLVGADHSVMKKHTIKPEGELKLVHVSARGKPVEVTPKAAQIGAIFDMELVD